MKRQYQIKRENEAFGMKLETESSSRVADELSPSKYRTQPNTLNTST